jgi:hypothetical protein
MKPRRTPYSNQVFRLVGGTEDNDLWTQLDESEDGTPLIRSTWQLDDDERQAIADGANVELIVWGTGTPPVLLQITDVPIGAR